MYIDEALLREAKVAAARSGRPEYEIFEEALRRHLGFGEVVERIWSKIPGNAGVSETEADRIAAEELAAYRSERTTPKAG